MKGKEIKGTWRIFSGGGVWFTYLWYRGC